MRVSLAKYGLGSIGRNVNQSFKQYWRLKERHKVREVETGKVSQFNIVKANRLEQAFTATLKGEANAEFMARLARSLVCESDESRDLEVLSKIFVNGGC